MLNKIIINTFKKINQLNLINRFKFTTRLERYLAIKRRNKQKRQEIKQRKSIQLYQQMKSINTQSKIRCEGCSVVLQTQRIDKYGYIEDKVLKQYLLFNQNLIRKSIDSPKTNNTIKIIRQVEQQMGVKILTKNSDTLENLDNVQVLLKLQQKIQNDNKERQVLLNEENKRKQLYCRRCFYLKHYNRLPDQHNDVKFVLQQTSEVQLLDHIFNKKGNVYYLYLVDIFDIYGTLTQVVLQRLFRSQMKFQILITKFDIVNKTYFNFVKMKPALKQIISQYLQKLKKIGKVNQNYKLEDYMQDIIFVSSHNKIGISKIIKKIQDLSDKVQMIGYPNTGKTSLLNTLTSSKKPTSSVPGTSLTFQIAKYNKTKIFDCPGFYNSTNLYNLIKTPNEKSILTWKQNKYAPGILSNRVIFYGGMIQSEGVLFIIFGNGGAKAIQENNLSTWLLNNYDTFWKGLPPLHQLQIKRHQLNIKFKQGKGPDLEISGYGFIGMRLSNPLLRKKDQIQKKIIVYLPKSVLFRLRQTLILENEIYKNSVVSKVYRLQRLRPKIRSKS